MYKRVRVCVRLCSCSSSCSGSGSGSGSGLGRAHSFAALRPCTHAQGTSWDEAVKLMNEAKGRAERETREEAEALGLSQDNDPWQTRGQKARGTDMRSVGNKSMLQPLALDKNAKNCFFMSKAKWGRPCQKHPIMCIEFTSKHQYVGLRSPPPHRPTAPPPHRPTAPPPHRPTAPRPQVPAKVSNVWSADSRLVDPRQRSAPPLRSHAY